MRVIVGTLACLGAVNVMVALANPPAPSPQPSAAAPVSSTPAAPAAAAPAPAQTTAAAVDPDEKRLIGMGYRLKIRTGERVFCHLEEELGSRLGGREICGTVADIKAAQAATHDDAEALRRQSLRVNPVGK